jgi:hypothetical protein
MNSRMVLRFATVAALAAGGAMVSAQGPLLPSTPKLGFGASVTPAYDGWFDNPDGTHTFVIGYYNRNWSQEVDIPIGPDNHFEPGEPDRGQPTHFLPRRQWGVFVISVPKDFGKSSLTWTLVANGQTTVIPMDLDPLWVVAPFKDVALGNTPPGVRFEAEGATHQGPPNGISRSYDTSVSHSLTLPAWVSDDGVRAPEARTRSLIPTVAWSKYRGPGDVVFDKAQPTVDEKTGSTTTQATFKTPGEYILRVQVNDATGDGGGGFQCCWTNAHVKVTVTADR